MTNATSGTSMPRPATSVAMRMLKESSRKPGGCGGGVGCVLNVCEGLGVAWGSWGLRLGAGGCLGGGVFLRRWDWGGVCEVGRGGLS